MKKMKDARSNLRIATVVTFLAAIICLLLSAFIEAGETAGILRTIGIVFLVAIIIQGMVFSIYPALFKNKKQKK